MNTLYTIYDAHVTTYLQNILAQITPHTTLKGQRSHFRQSVITLNTYICIYSYLHRLLISLYR